MSKKYNNPPIVEALCEFQFEPDPSYAWDLVMPGLIFDELQDTFPKREPGRLFAVGIETQFQFNEAVRFLADDEKTIALLGENILSVNRLRPYSSWEEFLPSIKRGFAAYRNVAKPKGLRGVELRYINNIQILDQYDKLEEYVNIRPSVVPTLSQSIESFIAGIQLPYEGSRDNLRIELTGFTDENTGAIHATLDLDYFLVETEEVNLEQIFQWVEVAHTHIEHNFEACITDQAKRMFEEVTN